MRDSGFWDGVRHPYIPGPDLAIDPSLRLHRAVAADIDPITSELVRYSLLNLNLEHTALLQKLAVSQLVMHSRDFQTAILTEDGEVVLVGPCIQFFAKCAGLDTQYVLEHRSRNPGISAGDMFLTNDCFVGASHQMDASLVAPVFVGDELFCWVTNTLHYHDLGGVSAGSFCHAALDAFDEPLHWPPVKIVEAGQLRDDIERLWVRQSRFPETVGMDLRASIAASEVTRGRIADLVGRYGADVVKGVMRNMQDAGERLFIARLRSIPDGCWSHRFYCEGATPGDDRIHTMQVNITKCDDRLVVDNRGTDPQVGSISMTYAGFSGAALAGIVGQVVPDVAGAFGGPYRRVEFRPEPGSILCASYPAAVSTAVFAVTMLINAVSIAMAKMLSCGDEETRALALGATWPQPGGTMSMVGVDADGDMWSGGTGNVMLGSFGGAPTRDGVDFGGHWWMPGTTGTNVEDFEENKPVVCLYQRGLQAGLDGAGRHRGGLGVVSAVWVRAGAMIQYATGEAYPGGAGVMGSPPGSRARATVVHGTDTDERLSASRIPRTIDEISGERSELPWKTVSYQIHPGDVIEGLFPTIAGYGDPLLRDPEAVLVDVRAQILAEDAACARVRGRRRRRRRRSRCHGRAAASHAPGPTRRRHA